MSPALRTVTSRSWFHAKKTCSEGLPSTSSIQHTPCTSVGVMRKSVLSPFPSTCFAAAGSIPTACSIASAGAESPPCRRMSIQEIPGWLAAAFASATLHGLVVLPSKIVTSTHASVAARDA